MKIARRRASTVAALKLLTVLLILLAVAASSKGLRVISNSEDWRDVYSVVLYSNLIGVKSNFLVSTRHSTLLLNSIPRSESILVISSKDHPFVIGYKAILQSRQYKSADEKVFKNVNLGLANLLTNITRFIIIDDSYGYNAISVAPYAIVSKSYVLFADKENIREVLSLLSKRRVDSLIIYGQVDRAVRNALAGFHPEIINEGGDRYRNNIAIVKKYLSIHPVKQAVLTNGEFIEAEIMSGVEPVIFIGSQNVPQVVRDFLKNSTLEIGVLIGNQYVGTATNIRRQTGLSVFVKFAQSARIPQGAISPVEGLDLFYLPTYTMRINITSMVYNQATNTLEVTLYNPEERAVYLKGTYTLHYGDNERLRVGDINPVFLDGKEYKTLVYEVKSMTGNISADAFVIFGESMYSLEKLLEASMNIRRVTILDNSNVEIVSGYYDKRKKFFVINIKNTGAVRTYVDVDIKGIILNNLATTISADKVTPLKPGETKGIRIKADLSDEDILNNEKVRVVARYGQREKSLVKSKERVMELKVRRIDYTMYILLVIIVILLFLILRGRRKKKCRECGHKNPRWRKTCEKCGAKLK